MMKIESFPDNEPRGFGIVINTREIILVLWNRAYILEFSG